MENNLLTKKISQYLEVTKKLTSLKSKYTEEKKKINENIIPKFQKLQTELNGYIVKIKPTVEMVCTLYRAALSFDGKFIYIQGQTPRMTYSALNACELAMQYGNEGIRYLTSVIQRVNVNSNLEEFVKRYNTIVIISGSINELCNETIRMESEKLITEINQLEILQKSLFSSEIEFRNILNSMTSNSKSNYMIGDSLTLEKSFKRNVSITLGFEKLEGSKIGLAKDLILSSFEWNLANDGILVLRKNKHNAYNKELSVVLNNVMLQFLFKYPSTFKRLLICDSSSSATITTFIGSLKDVSMSFFFNSSKMIANSEDDIRENLYELNRIINERIMLLGTQSRYSNVFEYNEANQDNPLPLILVVLNGYPLRYESASNELISVLRNGKKAGVFFIINESVEEDEESRYFRKRLPLIDDITKNIVAVKERENQIYLVKDNQYYCWDIRLPNYNVNKILGVFKTTAEVTDNKIVYLNNVVDNEDFNTSNRRKDFSRNLSIPIGKAGGQPVSIDLRADSSTAHLALIGTTGSGKTAFINSLVLSASKLYSPAELEFHLIVMVKGDFRIFEEEKLPHLKTVVTGDRLYAAADVLDFLDAEMKRRGELIGSYGSIYEYNKVASKPLSRCVIIIDEFMRLVEGSETAIKRIEGIAQVGRAYGISLIISSTSFPMEVNSIKPLIGNRIEFKAEEAAGQLIPEVSNRQNELESVKGLCFYARGGNIINLRVAYSEEGSAFKEHITDIKNKYPNYKMELQSDIKSHYISQETDIPFSVKRPRMDYEDGLVRTRIGKTYLSNHNLEFTFDSKNNLLFLFGHYLDTKNMEASLIKDVLYLAKGVDEPVVYYLDMNRNTSLRRAKTLIKNLRDNWVLSGKMVYASGDDATDLIENLKDLIETRETDEDSELYPILVIVARADNLFEDDDLSEELIELINRGKENNVYFAVCCDEPIRFYGCDKYMKNAIVFPDRYVEGDDYSSHALCKALESMPAGSTDKGRKLINNATASALNPKLHILCVGNNLTIFIPYEYDEDYLTNII